jgi:hypothetical protein
LLDQGYVSYSHICPEHGHYSTNITQAIQTYSIDLSYVKEIQQYLDQITTPLRIDFNHSEYIQNGSQTLSAVQECMQSFLHVVTETCFWDTKDHLTEKIFKPIVCKQPFVLLGCANNLAYLKRYGFKTFDRWWDESYDQIVNPIERLHAVIKIIKDICTMNTDDLEYMLQGMSHVLEHNYNLFYSREFVDRAWNELTTNLNQAVMN